MELNDELLNELKKHTLAIKEAMPDLSKEQRMELISKAINDSADIPVEMKESTIEILSSLED